MSLEKKVSIGMFAAALTGASCTDKNSAELGGVMIYEAVTDREGKAYFTEEKTDEEVEVKVIIKGTNFPVSDATILYFDHSDFKAFLMNHPAFAPQLQIAEHNSDHLYSLTPAPLQILHMKPKPEKEQSKPGAEAYLSWAKGWEESGWEHTGCLKRKNMVTLMKPGVFLMKKSGIIETIGFSEDKFDEGVEYIEKNLPSGAVADMYVFIPYKHGFSASTTTITALDIHFDGKCSGSYGDTQPGNDYGSSNNEGSEGGGSGSNNNGTNQDNGENDCSETTLFCDYFNGAALNSSKWNVINDSGIEVSRGWLSLYNASSIAAQNQFGNLCTDKQVDLRAAPIGSVFLGNMGLSANRDTGILSCDGEDAIVDISGAEKGLSLYKSGGLLSLLVDGVVTSVPCSEKISYVQLTAGLNDVVEIDYVRVKCK